MEVAKLLVIVVLVIQVLQRLPLLVFAELGSDGAGKSGHVGMGSSTHCTTVAPGVQACGGSPYLAVQAQGYRLVLQCHEEGAAIQLILQEEHNGVDCGRQHGSGGGGWIPAPQHGQPQGAALGGE